MNIPQLLRRRKNSPKKYRPLIEITISKANLIHNLAVIERACAGLKPVPVLKSNAYGHGLAAVARIMDKQNVPFISVDSLFEALLLRGAGIKSDLLIMGYTRTQSILKKPQAGIGYTITALSQLKELSVGLNFIQEFQLKIDTGMHRQGLSPSDLPTALQLIKANPHLKIRGVYSHLAEADNLKSRQTLAQITLWERLCAQVRQNIPKIKYYHLAASAGLAHPSIKQVNAARTGLSLYGLAPRFSGFDDQNKQKSANNLSDLNEQARKIKIFADLRPVLAMNTIISDVRKVAAGQGVGYNTTYKTKKPTHVAILPVGYYEGLDRRLSNIGQVLVKDRAVPIIGRVSMNITTVDVSALPQVKPGDQICVISRDPRAPNSIAAQARLANTIPYVLLAHLPAHLKRTII